jgi:hypothetical protein
MEIPGRKIIRKNMAAMLKLLPNRDITPVIMRTVPSKIKLN